MKVLILSDIHANYPALEAIIAKEKIWDKLIFLGDVVDYGPHPKECISFIQNNADYYVCGNHDYAIAFNADCNCLGASREYSMATREWHKQLLSKNEIDFLRAMPIQINVKIDDKFLFLSHATPLGDLSKYITEEELEEQVKLLTYENILLGHTHIQYNKSMHGSLIINPGSVGLSRNSDKACYAVCEKGDFTLRSVAYDVQITINDLMKSPIPDICKEGLKKVLLHK